MTDNETLQIFASLINNMPPGTLLDIKSSLTTFDPENYNTYYNIGQASAKVATRSVNPQPGIKVPPGYHYPSQQLPGLEITGLDMDEDPPIQVEVFVPDPTSILVHRPALKNNDPFVALFATMIEMVAEETSPISNYVFPAKKTEPLVIDPALTKALENLKKALVTDPDHLNPDTPVVDIVFGADNLSYYDMFVVSIFTTPLGVVIGFKDLNHYQGVKPSVILTKILAGQTNLPVPNETEYVLFSELKAVNAVSARDYAAKILQHGRKTAEYKNPSFLQLPAVAQDESQPTAPSYFLNQDSVELLMKNLWHGNTITTDTPVVRIVTPDKTFTGVVTLLHTCPLGLEVNFVPLTYKDSGYDTNAAMIRILAGIPMEFPTSVQQCLITNIESIVVWTARDYAASYLYNNKLNRNPLEDVLPDSLTKPVKLKELSYDEETIKLIIGLVQNVSLISPKHTVVNMVEYSGKTTSNIIITGVYTSSSGVSITYVKLEDLDCEAHLRLIAGQSVAVPKQVYSSYFRYLELLETTTAQDAASMIVTDSETSVNSPLPQQDYF